MGYAVFLGDVARDEYYQLDQFPSLGEKVSIEPIDNKLGGMIANAACVYRSYGEKTKFWATLNPHDIDLCQQLEEQCIDTSAVQYDTSLAESKCIICLAQGEHTVFIVNMGRHPVELSTDAMQMLCGADVVYTNYWELKWLHYGNMGPVELVRCWNEHGVKLVCDLDVDYINNELYRAFIPYTHLLFWNKVGFTAQRGCDSREKAAASLLQQGLHTLVVTLAEEGCIVFENGKTIDIPAIKVDALDVTGAGDTFSSSFTYIYQKTANAVNGKIEYTLFSQ